MNIKTRVCKSERLGADRFHFTFEMSSLMPYQWLNGTHISFGAGAVEAIKKYIPEHARVCVLADKYDHIYRSGVKEDVDKVLNDIHAHHEWVTTLEANPDYSTCLDVIKKLRKDPVDFILPVGGGSVMDAAKFISGCVKLPESVDPWETLKKPSLVGECIPLISVCTLAATGSEWNEKFVISRREIGAKVASANPRNFFKLSCLDPKYTLTVPLNQTYNGLFDSFCHVMEQYITGHFAPLQDRLSESVASTIIELAPKLISDPQNLNHRATAMQTSALALNNLLQTGTTSCWGTHRSSMVLTAKYGLDHGQSLVPLLPSLWRQFFDVKKFKLAQMADRVWGYKGNGGVDEKANFSIAKTEEWAKMLKFGLKISDYAEEKNPQAAIEQMVEHTWNMMGKKPYGEARMITKEDLKQIYIKSF